MEKITIELPQLILVMKEGYNGKYLERLAFESEQPKSKLTFQEDSKQDSRIIAIKYQVPEKENSIMYYSEAEDKYALITFNLGHNYNGRVLVLDNNNHKMGFNFQHFVKEGLRLKHIDRINSIENIREGLTPEYVAKKYKDFLVNLPRET